MTPEQKEERRAARAAAKAKRAEGRRVILSYDPRRHGTVVEEGREVSEVEWDDGVVQPPYVQNTYLVNEKKEA